MSKEAIRAFVRYYNVQNLGDDLMVFILTHRFQNVDFVISCKEQYSAFHKENANVTIKKDYSIVKKVIRRVVGIDIDTFIAEKTCDCVLEVGGSIFIEPTDHVRSYYRTIKSRQSSIPHFVIGSSFGPYRSETFYDFYKQQFSSYQGVSFRDTYSYSLFNMVLNASKATDIVFGLPLYYQPKRKGIHPIVFCIWNYWKDRRIIKETVRLINELKDHGKEVVLISFCEFEGDNMACEEINRESADKNRVINYDGNNVWEIIDEISNAEGVVGYRFHSIVIALAYGTPVFPIAYSLKTEKMLDDIHYKGDWDRIDSLNGISGERIIESFKNPTMFNNRECISDSTNQFKQFEKWVLFKKM